MRNLAFLGLGQAGGNICNTAMKYGFYSAAINYSARDLESLDLVEDKLHMYGSEGVGKERGEAIRLMNSNWDLAINFVKQHFSHPSIDIIFVPFSTAGGSGSGIAPILISMLMELMPEKVFVAMPILPDQTETYKSQSNCLEAFEDLSQLDITTLPIDNEQVRTTTSSVGRVGLYKTTNEKVIQLIKSVIDYTDQSSQYSVLDKKDLLSIFKTKGFATISEVSITNMQDGFELTETTFTDKIQASWNKSPFAKIENEQIVSAGIIFDGHERVMDCLNTNKVFSVFGNRMPLNLFEGYYNGHDNKVISVLSGLSLCKGRLNSIEKIVENNQEGIHAVTNKQTQYVANVNRLIPQKETPKKQPSTKDISNMISKFRR